METDGNMSEWSEYKLPTSSFLPISVESIQHVGKFSGLVLAEETSVITSLYINVHQLSFTPNLN